jgi:murein DD-endopeptidase MepM/ murein hydrolase activator NlpD
MSDPRRLEAKIAKLNRQADELLKSESAGRPRRPLRLPHSLAVALLLFWLVVPPFVVPLRGTFTSGFSLRRRPETMSLLDWELHTGLDIAAPVGTPVRAAKSGIVETAGSSDTLGNYVVIRHVLGFSTLYGHLSETSLRQGGWVLKGGTVGRVGQTGRATGPHLHFETRWHGRAVPPRLALGIDLLRRAAFRSLVRR